MSDVFFADARAKAGRSLLHKLSDLLDRAGAKGIFPKGARVAVKVHFGDMGNTGYLEASFARTVVGKLKEAGARPFLTDANTLYRHRRFKTKEHIATARNHGFTKAFLGAPIEIVEEFEEVPVEGAGIARATVAKNVMDADGLVVITHATGHMLYGFGGAIKNVAMGLSSPSGKQILHSDLKPEVKEEKCVACGTCVSYCPVNAISLKKGRKAKIDPAVCVGCGECITVCPAEAIPPVWKTDPRRLAEKTAAYARAVLTYKKKSSLFLNFLIRITPDCDCCDWTDPPFVPDLGILASRDILAVDQASVDLIRRAPLLPGSILEDKFNEKWPLWKPIAACLSPLLRVQPRVSDKFRLLHGVDVEPFLEEAECYGLGSRYYSLIHVS